MISITGNWMQTVAEMWLVVKLTGSGAAVGLTAGLQFLPMLLLAPWGGLLADRVDKRRLLMLTQSLMVIPALTLWALTVGGVVHIWMVLALVLVRGTINAVDNPTRQSFVSELVGPGRIVNAVSLNSVIVHSSRILGPAGAGAVIALFGVGPCFLLNALSFVAMLVVLSRIDVKALIAFDRTAVVRGPGALTSALRDVLARPELRIPLVMMLVIGTLSFNFQVLLPLLAEFTWHGSASTYALLTIAMGVGSITGALASGARNRVFPGLLVGAAALFGIAELGAAVAPSLLLQALALIPLGAASVTFAASVNSTLQLSAEPGARGRVMALYAVVFLGSTPVGAPIMGALAGWLGPRSGLYVGGVAALGTAVWAAWAFRRAGVLDTSRLAFGRGPRRAAPRRPASSATR